MAEKEQPTARRTHPRQGRVGARVRRHRRPGAQGRAHQHHRDEIRRVVGGRRHLHETGGQPHRRCPQGGAPRRGRGLRPGRHDRRTHRDWPRRSPTTRPPARWTCSSPPASASRPRWWPWPSTNWATTPSRSPARRPASSPTPRTPRPRSSTSGPSASSRPSRRARSSWWRASRACPPSRTSPRSAAAAPTPPPSRWRPPWAPRPA